MTPNGITVMRRSKLRRKLQKKRSEPRSWHGRNFKWNRLKLPPRKQSRRKGLGLPHRGEVIRKLNLTRTALLTLTRKKPRRKTWIKLPLLLALHVVHHRNPFRRSQNDVDVLPAVTRRKKRRLYLSPVLLLPVR